MASATTGTSIIKEPPEFLKSTCMKAGSILNGGDYSIVCGKVASAVKKNPYSSAATLGGLVVIGNYLGLRSVFTKTPAVRSVETAKKEINNLLDQVEKLVKHNDSRIEKYVSINSLRAELEAEGSSSRHDIVKSQLEKTECKYREICKNLGDEIHTTLANIQLNLNLDGETQGVITLRKIEADGLKKHIRLGNKDKLSPSDYIRNKEQLAEQTLSKLDCEFQEELNKIYYRAKKDNPSNEDFFPERKAYQSLQKDLYQGLCEVSQTLNTLKESEQSILQKVYEIATKNILSTTAGLGGLYRVSQMITSD